jgi:hypothetical protein
MTQPRRLISRTSFPGNRKRENPYPARLLATTTMTAARVAASIVLRIWAGTGVRVSTSP